MNALASKHSMQLLDKMKEITYLTVPDVRRGKSPNDPKSPELHYEILNFRVFLMWQSLAIRPVSASHYESL